MQNRTKLIIFFVISFITSGLLSESPKKEERRKTSHDIINAKVMSENNIYPLILMVQDTIFFEDFEPIDSAWIYGDYPFRHLCGNHGI